ncbi:DUF2290 domain-containing protein [Pannonibacter phragmitetus]|uniref:DUF2290 domain-containing protein n=1 Tax=Pannonibacter phragmitetus TaxID=121719 RepID=UPI003D2EB12B
MATLDEIRREIIYLTGAMIEVGLSIDQNFPSEKIFAGENGGIKELTVPRADEISVALKRRPYAETYAVLKESRAYNMRLIDGALIQMRYRFDDFNLIKHVLAFYPSPDLLEYQNDPELYEAEILYADVIHKDVVTTPIRFDFDESAFQEVIHPKSHFTIGQYKNCRIPVLTAMTPFRFINFILRAFYNSPYREFCSGWKGSAADFPPSATDLERADLHLSFS